MAAVIILCVMIYVFLVLANMIFLEPTSTKEYLCCIFFPITWLFWAIRATILGCMYIQEDLWAFLWKRK